MAADPNCIFCKIVTGEVPCLKLFEDAQTLAFMDISPVHDGHCLVIPKAHYPNVFEVSPRAMGAAAQTAAKVAKAVNHSGHRTINDPDGLEVALGPGTLTRPFALDQDRH